MAYKFNPFTGKLEEYGPILTGTGTVAAAADGTAALPGISFANDLSVGIYRPGAEQLAFSTNGTGRLFIDASGNVGVGALPLTNSVVINRGTESLLRLQSSVSGGTGSDGVLLSIDSSNQGYLWNYENAPLIFGTGNTERLRITSAGLVGVGTSSPIANLHVVNPTTTSEIALSGGTTAANYSQIGFYGGSTRNAEIAVNSNYLTLSHQNSGVVRVETGGTERARIDSSGRLLVGTSSARSNFFNATNITPGVQIEQTGNGGSLSIIRQSADSGGAFIALSKSRGTAVGSNTLPADNDDLGGVLFLGSDGSEFVAGAGIVAQVDGTPGADDMPGRLVFSTTADGASSPTERMRISNDGWTNLFVTNNDGFQSRNSAAAGTSFGFFVGRHSATGTTDGTISYVVYTNGNVGNTNNSYGAISDLKLKENIVDANSQWDDIKALQVRNYNFKEGQTHTQIGLVAQEVELVSPGLVSESPDRDAEGNDLGTVTKSVNYSVLYMKAVKALQEAMERIETLEAKVAALEGA